MKKDIILLFSLLAFLSCMAQETLYDHIQLGNHQIGFYDTVIYDTAIQYEQFGYKGPKPIFCKIWFPIENSDDTHYLKFGDFNKENVPNNLFKVHQELSNRMNEIFIRDGVAFDISNGDSIDYGTLTVEEVLTQIKTIETRSKPSKIQSKLDYPVIVYHHGSQGLSTENTVMGEYFSSNGYIFISANFHLPYPNTIYGLLPLNLESPKMHNQSTPKSVIQFAKSLTHSDELTFIGHSWGAQEGWCFLNDTLHASAFVSMETTIEYQSDSIVIKDLWPYVYDALKVKDNKFSIPILLFAASDGNMSFDFFKGLSNKKMLYASYKEPFSHNSYTSLLMMRYFLNNHVQQPDADIMLTQIKGYSTHLDLIFSFLRFQKTGNKAYLEKFKKQFIIKQE